MGDFGLASNGTSVAFATCMDERHPPENIVDG
jgi:carbonic anhydrase